MYTPGVHGALILLTASLATALVYGWGGVLAVKGTLQVGTVVALTAVPDPALRAAHRAVERPGRHHDGAGVASTGCSRSSTSRR